MDMKKLKRPLVVSFRKIPKEISHASCSSTHSQVIDSAAHRLNKLNAELHPFCSSISEISNPYYINSYKRTGNDFFPSDCHHTNFDVMPTDLSKSTISKFLTSENDSISEFSENTSSYYDHSNPNYYLQRNTYFEDCANVVNNKLYISPYASPEMTYNSRMFEENLNKVLKELVFKGNTLNTQTTTKRKSVKKWIFHNDQFYDSISKSKSVPSFFNMNQ